MSGAERLLQINEKLLQLETKYAVPSVPALTQSNALLNADDRHMPHWQASNVAGAQTNASCMSSQGIGTQAPNAAVQLDKFLTSAALLDPILNSATTAHTNRTSVLSHWQPLAAPKSTWECDKSNALLSMEKKLQQARRNNVEYDENIDPGISQQNIQKQQYSNQPVHNTIVLQAHSGARTQNHTLESSQQLRLGAVRSSTNITSRGAAGVQAGLATWESTQSRALLSLESERDSLMLQLQQNAGLQNIHKRELVELHARHARSLKDAQGDAGKKLRKLYKSSAAAYAHARVWHRLGRAFAMWRSEIQQTRRLAWAARSWDTAHVLHPAFHGWLTVTKEARHQLLPETLCELQRSVLLLWQQQAACTRRLKSLSKRCQHMRLAHLLAAWWHEAAHLANKKRKMQRAAQQHSHSLQARGFYVLAQDVANVKDATAILHAKLSKLRLRMCIKGWQRVVELSKCIDTFAKHGRMRIVFRAWHHTSHSLDVQRQQITALTDTWNARTLSTAFHAWHSIARWLADLHAAEQTLQGRSQHFQKLRAFHELSKAIRVQRFITCQQSFFKARVWHTWCDWSCRHRRNTRVAAAAAASRLLHVLRQALTAWMVLAVGRRVRILSDDMSRTQAYVAQLQCEADEARTEQFAAVAQADTYRAHVSLLEREARRSLMQRGSGSLVGCQAEWLPLPTDPAGHQPLPRARHSMHWLPALQHNQDHVNTQLSSESVIQQDVFLLHGGVSGDTWLWDLQAVTITHSDAGITFCWSAVRVDAASVHDGKPPALLGSASTSAGPSCFAVIGGFDGQHETMDIYLYQVAYETSSHLAGSISHPANTPSASSTALAASAQLIVPRTGRQPPGRTDHTACHHWPSRSLIVFGGQSSAAGGCMSGLWVFDMQEHRWWQPDVTGADMPQKRRNHVAAIVGNALYIHGGYDGTSHLSDLWKCDLQTWVWTRIMPQGITPTARRGHACDVMDQRYILMTGGYDGSKHLSDACVFDTHTSTWQYLQTSAEDVPAGSFDSPPPCALHSLTCAGEFCVQYGGSGASGTTNTTHLLMSTGLLATRERQRELLYATQELDNAQRQLAMLHAELEKSSQRQQSYQRQAQAMESRCQEVVQQHARILQDAETLQLALLQQQTATRQAEARAEAAEIAAETAKRRLARAREAGVTVAVGAEKLQQQLQAADQRLDEQATLLADAQAQAQQTQAMLQQVLGERNLLHVQLATANNEVTILRELLNKRLSDESTRHVSPPRRPSVSVHSTTIDGADGTNSDYDDELAHPTGISGSNVSETLHSSTEANQVRTQVAVAVDCQAGESGTQTQLLEEQLASEKVRAAAAERQLAAMEVDYAMMKAQLTRMQAEHASSIADQKACQDMAQSALSQLKECQLHHQDEVQELRAHIRALQMQHWKADIEGNASQDLDGFHIAAHDPVEQLRSWSANY